MWANLNAELGRHEGPVSAVAWSSDGRVVSGGDDGRVLLWDPAVPGKPATELGRHEISVIALAWSSDGRVVSGGEDRKVLLWGEPPSSKEMVENVRARLIWPELTDEEKALAGIE
jgi:WD40 repeat protein